MNTGTNTVEKPFFLFIVCCGRSGSTLLRSMFDARPDLAIPGESYFVTELLHRLPKYTREGFDASRFVEDVVSHSWTTRKDEPSWIDQWGIERDLVRQFVIEARPRSYAEAVRAVFRAYAEWRGKPLYGDKTPSYVTKIEVLGKLFPEARFLHLLRDGRNVALSYVAARFGPTSIEEAALRWRSTVQAGRRGGARVGPTRYKELKYESLIEQPETCLRDVCQWLEMPFYDEMLDHRAAAAALPIAKAFQEAHQNIVRPVQKGIRHWRDEMSNAQAERFEVIAGKTLLDYGYPLSTETPRAWNRISAFAKRSILEGKKLSRRVRGLKSADWW